MSTQIYLKVYSTKGVVRKVDAKKMTCLYSLDLRNGVVTIPVAHKDIAHLFLDMILTKKYTKRYNYLIVKKYFNKKQLVKTKVLDHGSIN